MNKLVTGLVCLGLFGCSQKASVKPTFVTTTAFQPFIPLQAERYEVKKNEKFVLGEPIGRLTLPIYPSLARYPTDTMIHVCLEISINADGYVYTHRQILNIPHCRSTALAERAFVKSAENAVMDWRFEPARLCVFPKHVDAALADNDCAGSGVHIQNMPVKLAFDFTFASTRAGTRVQSSAIQSRP